MKWEDNGYTVNGVKITSRKMEIKVDKSSRFWYNIEVLRFKKGVEPYE
jgi:hypothetical protein